MSQIFIYGSGGHAKVIATVLESMGLALNGFLDDNQSLEGEKILGIPILGGLPYLDKHQNLSSVKVIVGIGDNASRKKIFTRLTSKGISAITAIHSSCIIHPSVTIGVGTVAMAGVIVNLDSSIADNVILNTGVRIDHDCVIESHVHLAPGVILAGKVMVEEGAFLGVGAKVIPGIRIGKNAIVGAGAVVIRNVKAGQVVAGVPARELSKRDTPI